MTSPILIHSPVEMKKWRAALLPGETVGLVPTMGALHEGHAELLRRLRPRCDRLVLSIFVNPTQFGPQEDLAKYPRTFDADWAVAARCGVDAVFYPTAEALYPAGYSTYVTEEALTQPLCGEFRPGHFRGVTTIVLKLFHLVKPRIAYFGLKDAQQFFVLHKMAKDLELDVSVEGVATVRESDGLALSSRNRYLSPAERTLAPSVYSVLQKARAALASGIPVSIALKEGRDALEQQGFRAQYLDARNLPDLGPFRVDAPAVIAVAAYLGTTRLIDNVILHPDRLADIGISIHDSPDAPVK